MISELPLISYTVWLLLQVALGSLFISLTVLAPFWLAALVQTQYAKASRIKGETTTVFKSAADDRHTKARSA